MLYLEKENALAITSLDTKTAAESLAGERAETYRSIPIYRYQNNTSFSQILTPLINDFEAKFYFVHDEFIIFGSSLNVLRDIIANILNQTVLYQQDYYKNTIKDLTDEYEMTTVVVSHDMNSVLQVGDTINYMHEGRVLWKGTSEDIGDSDVKELNDFVFAGKLMKMAKGKM